VRSGKKKTALSGEWPLTTKQGPDRSSPEHVVLCPNKHRNYARAILGRIFRPSKRALLSRPNTIYLVYDLSPELSRTVRAGGRETPRSAARIGQSYYLRGKAHGPGYCVL